MAPHDNEQEDSQNSTESVFVKRNGRKQLKSKDSVQKKWKESRVYLGQSTKERWNKLKRHYKFKTDHALAEFLMDSCDVDATIPDLEPIDSQLIDNSHKESQKKTVSSTLLKPIPTSCDVAVTLPDLEPITSQFVDNLQMESQGSKTRIVSSTPLKPRIAKTTAKSLLELESVTDSELEKSTDNEPSFRIDTVNPVQLFRFVGSGTEATKEEAFIAYKSSLEDLALSIPPKKCTQCWKVIKEVKTMQKGSALHIQWVCPSKHIVQEWMSQPMIQQGRPLGDLMMGSSIIFSGCKFKKMEQMANHMNLAMMSSATFYRYQRLYVFPVVVEYWDNLLKSNCEEVTGRPIIILGDGRNDSPGHSAKYCTYTVVEQDTMNIVAFLVVDKRTTKLVSTNMEVEAFKIVLNHLLEKEMNVVEVVTDAHSSVTKWLREKHPNIFHSYDVWHGAKNFGKKLTKLAKTKGNAALLPWVTDIVNHFWFCCKESNTYEEFMGRWRGILHHIVGKHEWDIEEGGISRCEHGELQSVENNKENLVAGSKPHTDLRRALFEKRFLKTVPKFLTFRSTAELENYHELILMYCSKRIAYKYPAYKARNLLAAIDYCKHKGRQQSLTQAGKPRYHRKFNKKSKRWTISQVKTAKTYEYVQADLLPAVIEKRLNDIEPIMRKATLSPRDPRKISSTIAPVHPTDTTDLVVEHKSRGLRK